MLVTYHKHWQHYSRGSGYLNQLYGYLNSQFIHKQQHSEADINYGGFGIELQEQLLEIGALALDIWKRVMVEPLKENLAQLLLEEMEKDRRDGNVRQSIIHSVINSLVHVDEYKKKSPLKLYEDVFEVKFLRETGEYYHREALQLLDDCTCSEYMDKVIQRLDDEDMRSRKFLHPSSYCKVTKECEQKMVADHLAFLHSECRNMVAKEKRHDMSNLYRLLCPISKGLDIFVQDVKEHIKQEGLTAVASLKGDSVPSQFVESLLEVHAKYSDLITEVFKGDQHFIGALDKAFAAVINHRSNFKSNCRSPELVAKYCDSLLKKTAKGMSETEIDDKLSQSITIFRYLDDKDIYQRFYARMLAKRLIYTQFHSMDAEESMINRLKQACGYEFTNKLHRMFTDMSISSDLNSKFSDFCKEDSTDLGINFSILVLQAGAWPIGQNNLPTFAIPQELEKSVRMFEVFYGRHFNGRKLTWMHSFCNAELKLTYLKRPYIVTLGTFHMALLLPFNSSHSVSFRDLVDISRLPEKELLKQVQVLLDAKIIVSNESTATMDGVFSLNLEYTNKRTKFKIITSVQRETPQEVEQTMSNVDEDRKMYVQAAIVRTMKARKVLKHNALIQEVISQSRARFAPSISMIKKCIETLIDKQYIERSSTSTDEYSYIA
ncbi:hypothetical protein CAPTEDRAFT_175514 [Capitella teleta]|uniref:Cullin-2 n=1 Tax=Capitella teleta TaxID=283909 RepID=R7U038_CAPTE|nr:hypothetical protein CAPTEDRAFT_175514 [Capitella teleta]|eukprot:ELT99573.1 hypothetical protein CAPTEDRAFT_175514 [Capitella teleta]